MGSCKKHASGSKLEEPKPSEAATVAYRLVLDLAAAEHTGPVDSLAQPDDPAALCSCALPSWADWNLSFSLGHRTDERPSLRVAVHRVGDPACPRSLAVLDGGSLTSFPAIHRIASTAWSSRRTRGLLRPPAQPAWRSITRFQQAKFRVETERLANQSPILLVEGSPPEGVSIWDPKASEGATCRQAAPSMRISRRVGVAARDGLCGQRVLSQRGG